jgi:hypothetical protein
MHAQVGDVIRWDRAWGRDLDPALWTLVTDPDGEGEFFDIALNTVGQTAAGELDGFTNDSFPMHSDSAEADIINPNDWPEWVCVAVAKYRLLGEV